MKYISDIERVFFVKSLIIAFHYNNVCTFFSKSLAFIVCLFLFIFYNKILFNCALLFNVTSICYQNHVSTPTFKLKQQSLVNYNRFPQASCETKLLEITPLSLWDVTSKTAFYFQWKSHLLPLYTAISCALSSSNFLIFHLARLLIIKIIHISYKY